MSTGGCGFTVCWGFTVVPIMFLMVMLDKDEQLFHKTKNSLKNFMWKVQQTDLEVTAQVQQYGDNLSQWPPKTQSN